jgi:hypothetical protein
MEILKRKHHVHYLKSIKSESEFVVSFRKVSYIPKSPKPLVSPSTFRFVDWSGRDDA